MVIEEGKLAQRKLSGLYADVIIPRHLSGPFTYRVPLSIGTSLRVGHLVLVPFGRSYVRGAVASITHTPPSHIASEQLKDIHALDTEGLETELPPNLFRLAQLVAESYAAPLGQCLRLILPSTGATRRSTNLLRLTDWGKKALVSKSNDQTDALELLKRLNRRPSGIKRTTLLGRGRFQEKLVASLIENGWIEEVRESGNAARSVQRNVTARGKAPIVSSPAVSTDSMRPPALPEWGTRIIEALDDRKASRLLLQTLSNERLTLLRLAVEHTVQTGRTAIVIVGERERAESIAALLSQISSIKCGCLHSALSDCQKGEIWSQIRHARIQVVVGTRSAVFAPLESIGLLWIEREEDPALKEPQEPRYHAREVAWLRAQEERALLIIGSSHLTLETSWNAGQRQHLKHPPWRVGAPDVELIDLRQYDRGRSLSSPLVDAIQETLGRGSRVLLFLNRKGFAGAVICRDCGQVPRCPTCEVALAYYRHNGALRCAYCGLARPIPDACHSCFGPRLQLIGDGTERVENDVRRLVPNAKVLRIDGETTKKTKQAAELWRCVENEHWDVLIGTQVVLQDDVVPLVGLAAVVQADAGLSLPDFRAAERTFHLLCDATNFAQPAVEGGRAILQTLLPSHHAIQALVQRDEALFQSEELSQRTLLGYPPVMSLIILHVSGPQEATVERAALAGVARLNDEAAKYAASLKKVGTDEVPGRTNGMVILGPIPSPIPKLRLRYRRQILVKSQSKATAIEAVRGTITELERTYPTRAVKFDVDVDPLEMW